MRKLDIILTGTGRCATGFYAKYLSSAGIQCGHELFFSHQGLEVACNILSNHWTGTVADSSWLAVPYLDSEPLQDALIIHLVRHPKSVIESWLRVSPNTTPAYAESRYQNLPSMSNYVDDTPTQWAHVYTEWNRLIEKAAQGRDYIQWQVENEPIGLLDLLAERGYEVNTSDLFDDRKYNTKRGYNWKVYLDDIDEGVRGKLEAISTQYGYEWPDKPLQVQDKLPTIKVVVTSFDNVDNLKESIPILQSEPLTEIIVVNNGSLDGTREWLDQQDGVTAIHRENLGAGPGRNAGLNAARDCDYFLMLDGGIRPLRGGTLRMLEYLKRVPQADVIGVEIADFETDYEKAWYRWSSPIKAYQNTRLSHTAYCLARYRAFDGLRFSEVGPFGEAGWGADDDEMAYQWNEARIVIHVATGVHPYRRASGSFRRLYQETGIWPNQYGSTYEKRVVWLQHHWPQYEPGLQWGEPWLTVVVQANGVDHTAKLIKSAHNKLRLRKFKKPWDWYPNPYSIIACGDGSEWLDYAEPRHLRQHHGDTTIVNGEIVRRSKKNEDTWTGDFRICAGMECAVREGAHYYGLVDSMESLNGLLERYDDLHPHQPVKRPPEVSRECLM